MNSATQLKALIRNISKDTGVNAQILMQLRNNTNSSNFLTDKNCL